MLLLPAPKPRMRFMSLFSGVGGFDLGFERAGMTCVGMCELNKQAMQVLNYRWSYVAKREDVRHVTRYSFEPVDLICGGFPCQDVSVAGRRAGLAGERSGLWFEFHRIIDEIKPQWVVIENVPGLLTSNGGADFETVLSGLVGSGYRVGWRILDSQYFGVAQRRRRVFIVASLGNGRCAQVLFERESGTGNPEPGGETREAPASYVIKGAAIGRQPENGPQYGEISADGTCYTLNTSEVHAIASPSDIVAFNSEQTPKTARNVRLTLRAEYQAARLNVAFNKLRTDRYNPASVEPTLAARDYKDAGDLVATAMDVRNMRSNGEVSGTLQAKNNGSYSLNYINPVAFQWNASKHDGMPIVSNLAPTMREAPLAVQQAEYSVRRLTPRECERLQSFPDDWTLVNGMSDSARYRMMGNAVTVNVAEWIGKRILEAVR